MKNKLLCILIFVGTNNSLYAMLQSLRSVQRIPSGMPVLMQQKRTFIDWVALFNASSAGTRADEAIGAAKKINEVMQQMNERIEELEGKVAKLEKRMPNPEENKHSKK